MATELFEADLAPDSTPPPDAAAFEERERRYGTPEHLRRIEEKIRHQRLPVAERFDELVDRFDDVVGNTGVLLFQGETGSGKSVYAPQAVLQVLRDRGLPERVFVVQPRRDAASGVATAMAAVMGEKRVGDAVGYATSESKALDPRTNINVVTPGILLNMLRHGNVSKEEIGAIVVDELHEGSVEYHLILGFLKQMHVAGQAPLLLLTSATIDKERIQEFFGLSEREYLRMEGRQYPVSLDYVWDSKPSSDEREANYLEQTAEQIKFVHQTAGEGDILVFLPAPGEIEDVKRRLEKFHLNGVEILPLHGQLPPDERYEALSGERSPGFSRRVILSTNVAETSVTVPGIKYVIDTCRQKVARYNQATGITEKRVELISHKQAEQRLGRAGRLEAGRCYRVVHVDRFKAQPEHPESEMQRSNHANTYLTLVAAGQQPETFPFIDPPPENWAQHARAELVGLGALTAEGALTAIGRELIAMPHFEPRIGRLVYESKKRRCLEIGLVCAAFSVEGDVFLPPAKAQRDLLGDEAAKAALSQKRRAFDTAEQGLSDWRRYLNVFSLAIDHGLFEFIRNDRSPECRAAERTFPTWCAEYRISTRTLATVARHVVEYGKTPGLLVSRDLIQRRIREASNRDLARMLLPAFADQILVQKQWNKVMAAYGRPLRPMAGDINLVPGSVVFSAQPALCLAEYVAEGKGTVKVKERDATGRIIEYRKEIIRNYAHRNHPLEVEDVLAVLPERVRLGTYHFVHYDRVQDKVIGECSVYLDQTMIGELSREIDDQAVFQATLAAMLCSIDEAAGFPVAVENLALLREARSLNERFPGLSRPPDLHAWYVERLKAMDARTVKEFRAREDEVRMQRADVIPPNLNEEIERAFPKQVTLHGRTYALVYSDANASSQAVMTLSVSDMQDLKPHDIPRVGFSDHRKPVEVMVRVPTKELLIGPGSFERIKPEVDAAMEREAFEAWEINAPRQRVERHVGEELNPAEHYGLRPLTWVSSYSGEARQAFPAYHFVIRLSESVERFEIRYVASKAEAEAAAECVALTRLFPLMDQAQALLSRAMVDPQMFGFYDPHDPRLTHGRQVVEQFLELVNGQPAKAGLDPHEAEQALKSIVRLLEEKMEMVQQNNNIRKNILNQIEQIRAPIERFLAEAGPYVQTGSTAYQVRRIWERLLIEAGVSHDRGPGVLFLPVDAQQDLDSLRRYLKDGLKVAVEAKGAIAQAMEKKRTKKPDETEPAPASATARPVIQEKEQPATEEEREPYRHRLQVYRLAMEDASEQLRTAKKNWAGLDPKSKDALVKKRLDALDKAARQLKQLAESTADAEQLLARADARASQCKSKSDECRKKLDGFFERCLPGLELGTPYDAAWIDRYLELQENISAAIAAHPDVAEYVKEGLADPTVVAHRVRIALEQNLPRIKQGQAVDLDKLIQEAL